MKKTKKDLKNDIKEIKTYNNLLDIAYDENLINILENKIFYFLNRLNYNLLDKYHDENFFEKINNDIDKIKTKQHIKYIYVEWLLKDIKLYFNL